MTLASGLSRHIGHLLVFGVPTAALVAAMAWQELRGRAGEKAAKAGVPGTGAAGGPGTGARSAVLLERSEWYQVTAGSLVAAGVVHAAVSPAHFREYIAYGVFFALLTVGQWWTAVLWLRRPTLATAELLAAGSVSIVVLWVFSRTTGLPVGPHPWTPERVTAPDVLATCFEMLTCAACFLQVWTARHTSPVMRPAYEGATR